MTGKAADILRQMQDGKRLYEFKLLVAKKTTIKYKLENKEVHQATVKTIMDDFLMRGSSSKTSAGWKTELLLKD